MSQLNITSQEKAERARETAQARADLERRAGEQGVKPCDPHEWLAELEIDQTPEETRQEVDDFLSLVRESRDTPSSGSLD